MESEEFKQFRKKLKKTQVQMAQLLGVSLKAVHSYEQGWRRVPAAVERQVYFLTAKHNSQKGKMKSCWQVKKCRPEQKRKRLERKNEDLPVLRSI
jgi:predicted transcriptional regulator